MGYIGDGPKPELEVGDISTKDVTATGDVTISDKIIHSGDTNTAIRFAAADTVTVETAGSERMRILSGGGLTFNGDTAAANALDDYEEGTWTPTIAQGWTSVSYTNSYQFGRYTKIGNMVTAWFWLQFSGTSAGNQVWVGGLPFTTPDASNSELAHRGGAVTYFNAPVNAAGAITAYTGGGTTQIQFYAYDDSGASANANANASSAYLIGSVTYWVE